MKYKDHKEFFDSHENDLIRMRGGFLSDEVSVEEMYQHFKARMAEEIIDVENKSEIIENDFKTSHRVVKANGGYYY